MRTKKIWCLFLAFVAMMLRVQAALPGVGYADAYADGPGRVTCDAPDKGVPIGQWVTMKAIPDSDALFIGWYHYVGKSLKSIAGYLDFTEADATKKTLHFLVGYWEAFQNPDYTFYAVFVRKSEDVLQVDASSVCRRTVEADVPYEETLWIDAYSRYSSFTVTAKGLPPGLRCDKQGYVSGTPKKSKQRCYDVQLVVTNESGWIETWSFDVWVGHPDDEYGVQNDFYTGSPDSECKGDLKDFYRQGEAIDFTFASYYDFDKPKLKVYKKIPGVSVKAETTKYTSSSGTEKVYTYKLTGTFSTTGRHCLWFSISDQYGGEKSFYQQVTIIGKTIPLEVRRISKVSPRSRMLSDDDSDTLLDSGLFTGGKTYTSSIKLGKDSVFAGWYLDESLTIPATNKLALATGKDGDYRIAKQVWQPAMLVDQTGGSNTVALYAKVIPAEDDQDFDILLKRRDDSYLDYEVFDGESFELGGRWVETEFRLSTTSQSKEASVTVKGLPKGMVVTKSFGNIDGFKRDISLDYPMPGTYDIEIAIMNQSGSRRVRHLQLIVPRSHIMEMDYAGIEEEYTFGQGVTIGSAFDALKNIVGKFDWYSTALKVSGLPAGLKYDAKSKTIVGAPSVSGDFAVTFTMTTVYSDGYKDTERADLVFHVAPIPERIQGAFYGGATGDTPCSATLTVASTGKISGKYVLDGKTWTLSAKAFEAYDSVSGMYTTTLTAKSGKQVETLHLAAGADGVAETDSFQALWANWKTEPLKSEAKVFDKYVITYEVEDGAVTLTCAANGTVKVAGVFRNGVDKNGTPLLVKATGSATIVPTSDGYLVFVYLAPKGLPVHARWVEL